MEYREMNSDSEQIKDITYSMEGDICTLRWRWPNGIEAVNIIRVNEDEHITADNVNNVNSRLYTKDEYMEFDGYRERINIIGRFVYYIYPYIKENSRMVLINQDNISNRITVSTGKVRIYTKIKKKRKLFSNKAIVRIIVTPESPISRDVLCYIKKEGAYPVNNKDGLLFTFIEDFKAGENVLPDIEINNDEYVNVFIKDYEKYGSLYEICGN